MNMRTSGRTWAAVGIVAALAYLGAFLYGTSLGLAGMTIGIAGGGFGAYALFLMIRLLEASAAQQKPGSFGVALVLLMVAAKIPVLLFLSQWSQAIGAAAFDCFLAGVMLVYFGLIAWAGTRPADGPTASDGHSAS